jgi:hypothetical protein
MILLASGCMLFELPSGESIPFSAEMISIEVMGDAVERLDPELVSHAASSVFHYFKRDLARKTVTVGEFAEALEKVLQSLGFQVDNTEPTSACPQSEGADLRRLARESGDARELSFFPRLRNELRAQLRQSPRVVRFRGLRGCVKQLAGARRWSSRCQNLHDQIVGYLRSCLGAEGRETRCTLVVE